eukprot:CAMPEP_0113949308 /NCGR_PEP_ID=MMETSP1339-20121228/75172_1 /TAXON_ID=94617 /ORGANISM="Fibrocapsa japonica" /LENGTH=73 /DNA_ID=CAMNT_0000956719 /DNA_START=166 /DNA_END=384 /DNA_ORIENTATION=- /assembly_acc=CAM_ASM_000762
MAHQESNRSPSTASFTASPSPLARVLLPLPSARTLVVSAAITSAQGPVDQIILCPVKGAPSSTATAEKNSTAS